MVSWYVGHIIRLSSNNVPERNSTAPKQPMRVSPSITKAFLWAIRYASKSRMVEEGPRRTIESQVLASGAVKWVIGHGV